MTDILKGKEFLEPYLLARKISEESGSIERARNSVTQFFEGKSRETIIRETGTAMGGIVGAGGKIVILGADGQMTSGYQKVKGFKKIFEIDKYTAVGTTGSVAFLQDVVKIFEAEVNFIQMSKSNDTYISPSGKATILSDLVKSVIMLPLHYGIGMGFLLAIYNPKDDEARLFEIGPLGSIVEPKNNIAADGCGRDWVYSVLEDSYKKLGGIDMDKKNLLRLIKRAIGSAVRNDIYCGSPKLFYLVDKNGARRVK